MRQVHIREGRGMRISLTRKSPENLDLSSPCLSVREQLNDSCCYSSSTEAGVLIAYHQATAQPLPKEVLLSLVKGLRAPPLLEEIVAGGVSRFEGGEK
ncbi:hypothetical protein AVEN_222834-1 [Araneus ventricosus]|uniref:Uncharacterized protein n=1 Tax=Araneus ventricosus TaxID=182803 RepID=A0A4Y2JT98_ARAVE|nr:hypothetical protein AVEN_222834-1 [Araneus ventricosus]